MVKKTVAKFYSDVSGDEIAGTDPTIKFSVGGVDYEIDLTADKKSAFDTALAPFLRAARKPSLSRADDPKFRPKVIREWARSQGIDVPERGRIPTQVRTAYEQAT